MKKLFILAVVAVSLISCNKEVCYVCEERDDITNTLIERETVCCKSDDICDLEWQTANTTVITTGVCTQQ